MKLADAVLDAHAATGDDRVLAAAATPDSSSDELLDGGADPAQHSAERASGPDTISERSAPGITRD
ncbi:hypothetical protein [Micromonospora sp. ATA51]|uniref:hypothetical protein n=1 Tax=Micromonospora sp. ATA51 TaxID=2806098 RepID=UPI001EE4E39D|nr:hypothetical protein [Micromonospora sp. ATA51]